MADYVHELVHNRTERVTYGSALWRQRFNEAVDNMILTQRISDMVQPAEQSDDPWASAVIHPTNEELGTV